MGGATVGRFGDIILLVLVVLIILSPLLWLLGVPLLHVVGVTMYWVILWLLASTIGRKYEH